MKTFKEFLSEAEGKYGVGGETRAQAGERIGKSLQQSMFLDTKTPAERKRYLYLWNHPRFNNKSLPPRSPKRRFVVDAVINGGKTVEDALEAWTKK
jgi:hypothetical protein